MGSSTAFSSLPHPIPPPSTSASSFPHTKPHLHFLTRLPHVYPLSSLSSSSSSSNRSPWVNPKLPRRRQSPNNCHYHHQQRYIDRSVDMDALLSSLSRTSSADELHTLMSVYIGSANQQQPHLLSLKFMIKLLSLEPDHRRCLALLDWMHGPARYPPSVFSYNVAIRNSLRSLDFPLALGLFHELRSLANLSPDPFTYSTLLSSLLSHSPPLLDQALSLLPLMHHDSVSPDLVLFTNLINLARRLNDPSKASILFSRLTSTLSLTPDLLAYNAFLHALSRASLFRDARNLLDKMHRSPTPPDTVSYSTLLAAMVRAGNYLEALSLFAEMRSRGVPPDVTTCNIMIDAYGQLDMAREADRLFWSMRRVGLNPTVVTYNTMLRVYGDAELFGEAIHLFRLMQRKSIEQNVVTYNTMIRIYGKSLEHEKAGNLVQEMKRNGIEPNAVTYSTIISIWGKAGKIDRAAMLFQKLRSSGAEIDPVLYQTMIAVYERAGLVGHAKRLIHDLRQPDNVPKETAVSVLAKAGRVEEAAWVFRQAVVAGEVRDVAVFKTMMELFARSRRHKNVVEVFNAMRADGFFPDSQMVEMVMNAYGKMQEFDEARALYEGMKEEGCVFEDRVHFQMLSLLGARRDFEGVEELFEELRADPNIDKKELHLVAANVYERANKLDEAARIVGMIRKSSNVFALQ